jgi:predicted nucleic acid-binding protein
VLVVIDTSAVIAVLTSEPERPRLVRATQRADLAAPASVHWEVGNALSALLKRRRVGRSDLPLLLDAYEHIPIRFLDVDLALALEIAAEHGLYAYDAYLITCALAQRAPLLSLDQGLGRAAEAAGVQLLELPA